MMYVHTSELALVEEGCVAVIALLRKSQLVDKNVSALLFITTQTLHTRMVRSSCNTFRFIHAYAYANTYETVPSRCKFSIRDDMPRLAPSFLKTPNQPSLSTFTHEIHIPTILARVSRSRLFVQRVASSQTSKTARPPGLHVYADARTTKCRHLRSMCTDVYLRVLEPSSGARYSGFCAP